MMRAVRGVRAVFLALALAGCSTEPPGEVEETLLEVLGESHFDAGSVPLGTTVEQTFLVQNNSDQLVVLDSVQTSCGCSSASVTPSRVQPGGVAEVHVIVDADSAFGKSVFVLVSSTESRGFQARLDLVLRSALSDMLLVQPSAVEIVLDQGGWGSAQVEVRCVYRGENAPAVLVAARPDWLSVSQNGAAVVRDLGGGVGEARYPHVLDVDAARLPAEVDMQARTFVVHFDASGLGATAAVDVRVSRSGPFTYDPGEVYLGSGLSKEVVREVRFERAWSGVDIERVYSLDAEIEVDWRWLDEERNAGIAEVRYMPGRVDGDGAGLIDCALLVEYSDKVPLLSIPVTGWRPQ